MKEHLIRQLRALYYKRNWTTHLRPFFRKAIKETVQQLRALPR